MCGNCKCSCDINQIDKNVEGTYMASLSDEKGYLNRVIISFHTNGIMHVTSEGQDGKSSQGNYTPISTQSGNWKIRNNKIYATCVNFTNSNFRTYTQQSASSNRYVVKNLYKFTLNNGILCGSLSVMFFAPLTSSILCSGDDFMKKCAKPEFSLEQRIEGYFICP